MQKKRKEEAGMKVKKILATIWMIAAILLITAPHYANATEEAEEIKTLDLLFIHDMHSHLNTFTTMEDGKAVQVGGLSRMMTLVKEQTNGSINQVSPTCFDINSRGNFVIT